VLLQHPPFALDGTQTPVLAPVLQKSGSAVGHVHVPLLHVSPEPAAGQSESVQQFPLGMHEVPKLLVQSFWPGWHVQALMPSCGQISPATLQSAMLQHAVCGMQALIPPPSQGLSSGFEH
jgi:hypothetical protein